MMVADTSIQHQYYSYKTWGRSHSLETIIRFFGNNAGYGATPTELVWDPQISSWLLKAFYPISLNNKYDAEFDYSSSNISRIQYH